MKANGTPSDKSLKAPEAPVKSRRVLSLFDCVCIIVGTIIGSGIFKIPSIVAANAPSIGWMIIIWGLGGLIALCGALCFAELTTTYPDRGGDYGYLKRAFGRTPAFLFSWAAFWIIRPGNIGAMAVIFGISATDVFPGWIEGKSLSVFLFSMMALAFTSTANLLGLGVGKFTQNFLTVAKVGGILLILAAAFAWGQSPSVEEGQPASIEAQQEVADSTTEDALAADDDVPAESAGATNDPQDESNNASSEWFWLSLVFVMFAFGGWNDIAFVAGETRDPEKNLFRALLLGTGAVVLIYFLVNAALIAGLGFERLASLKFQNAPFVLVNEQLGPIGGRLVGILVCVSCLGAMSAMIFTSPRIYWATANDFPALSWLAGSQTTGKGWWPAMLLQTAVTGLLLVILGLHEHSFDWMVQSCAPYFWSFLALTVLAMILLRYRSDSPKIGFRVPLFPVLPLLFIAACLFMVVRSWQFMWSQQLYWFTAGMGLWLILPALVLTLRPLISSRSK